MVTPSAPDYRESWVRFLRDIAEAVRDPNQDAGHLKPRVEASKSRWAIPVPEHRKDLRQVFRALSFMAQAYAEARSNAGRRALAEPLLAWAGWCAELMGTPLAEPAPPRMPYRED